MVIYVATVSSLSRDITVTHNYEKLHFGTLSNNLKRTWGDVSARPSRAVVVYIWTNNVTLNRKSGIVVSHSGNYISRTEGNSFHLLFKVHITNKETTNGLFNDLMGWDGMSYLQKNTNYMQLDRGKKINDYVWKASQAMSLALGEGRA